jgi:hypothetical protein
MLRAPTSTIAFSIVVFCGFHVVGMCQTQNEGKPHLKLTLSEKNLGKMQILDISSLRPGSTNSILFDVLNELPEKVDLDEIRLSCGCMSYRADV